VADSNREWVLARREFLKTTGALVVGFSMADVSAAQIARSGVALRGVVSGPPDEAEIDSYLAVHPDNTVTVFAGYVELGQGGPTALRQVAAEELDLEFDQVSTVRMDTFVSTNGFTAASRTAGIGGTQLRAAAAEARHALLTLASERLQAPIQELTVTRGVVSLRTDPQRSVSYGGLLGNKPFNRRYEPVSYNGGIEIPRTSGDHAAPKPRTQYKIVGSRVPRFDIPDKVSGK
jgi:nicotinate dehydrogenase subunit B